MAKKFSVIAIAIVALGFGFARNSNADVGDVQEPAAPAPATPPSYNYAPPPPPVVYYPPPPPVRLIVYPSIGFYPHWFGFHSGYGYHHYNHWHGRRVYHRPYHWR